MVVVVVVGVAVMVAVGLIVAALLIRIRCGGPLAAVAASLFAAACQLAAVAHRHCPQTF